MPAVGSLATAVAKNSSVATLPPSNVSVPEVR
jgi:hypothetical protein